ncbi:MAG: diguanylate cyclase [Aquificota bacterium]|nr:diguanylate cyclase [Aquificota bacterium]
MSRIPISIVGNRTLNINHNVALEGESFNGFEEEKLRMRTKTLVLDKPHLGGVVGVGITTDLFALDRHREPVIDTVLATLVNVIGSTKAISSYIKDIEFYAMRDPLTFLYNQRTFWELLNYEIERANRFGRKLSLIMMDLDNFKVINDTYGHAFGDKILREVARILSETKRKADVASRYGGDEFAIIAVGSDVEQAFSLAKRIKDAIESSSFSVSGQEVVVLQVSIGISTYPDHAKNPKDLFLIADSMLRKAKEEGRSRIRVPSLKT